MRRKKLEKVKVIQTRDPDLFEEQYNKAMDELEEFEPRAEIQPFSGEHCAYIYYHQVEELFTLVSDEFHAEGIHYLCSQCPYHDPAEDGRQKHVYCRYADTGMTDLRREACEMFYKQVKQNEVKPVY